MGIRECLTIDSSKYLQYLTFFNKFIAFKNIKLKKQIQRFDMFLLNSKRNIYAGKRK